MDSAPGAWTGRAAWIICWRSPRLNSAVASVAVETRLSLARVASDKGMRNLQMSSGGKAAGAAHATAGSGRRWRGEAKAAKPPPGV